MEIYDRGLVEGVQATVIKVCHDVTAKFITSIGYILFTFFFDQNNIVGLKSLLILIVVDFITAVTAAYHTGEEIKSSKIFRTVVKIVVYFLMIALAHITENTVPIFKSLLDETVLAFLSLTELISNLENIGRLGFSVPQKLLNKLRKEVKNE